MRSRVVAGLIGVGLAVAAVAAPAASAAPSASAPLPAVGSWAFGWSAVVVRAAEGDELRALDPRGGVHTLAEVPEGTEIVDVRHDARRVITKSAHGEGDPVVFRIWDVATKKSWKATLPTTSDLYFGPGDQLVSESASPSPRTMLRSAAGSPIRTLSLPGDWRGAVSPGGTAIYAEGPTGTDIFSVAADRVVRTIPNQPPNISCVPGGLWPGGKMRFGCYDIPGNSRFYTANIATGVVTPSLTHVPDAGYGFPTYPPGPNVGMAAWGSSCTDRDFVATDDGFESEPVRPEGPWGEGPIDYRAIAGSGGRVWMIVTWSCDKDESRTSLVEHGLPTGMTLTIAGPAPDSEVGSVRSAQTIDGFT